MKSLKYWCIILHRLEYVIWKVC